MQSVATAAATQPPAFALAVVSQKLPSSQQWVFSVTYWAFPPTDESQEVYILVGE